MHPYRTHRCCDLTMTHVDQMVRLSGWLHSKRDHGNLIFIDLRDRYGITQCVIDIVSPLLKIIEGLRVESVVTITGHVVKRPEEMVNPTLNTGEIEVIIEDIKIQSRADVLPFQVASDAPAGEEVRLRYRFLDLRRERIKQLILLRSNVIASLRRRMIDQGFTEFQTPILTASSPEGARDFLIPSRLHAGKFYALPQAPQQFKQLLMIAGFDRYFQIAPCFRDEDSRADRSPGEFYQLDFEMSFVTQEDVFKALEPVLYGVFEELGSFRRPVHPFVTPIPFPRIPYTESMLSYGTDKPDLRNPLIIKDVSDIFQDPEVTFQQFRMILDQGGSVRAIRAPDVKGKPRRFFDRLIEWSKEIGAPGLGYILFDSDNTFKGPMAKFMPPSARHHLAQRVGLQEGDAVFFMCDQRTGGHTFCRPSKNADRTSARSDRGSYFPILLDHRLSYVSPR